MPKILNIITNPDPNLRKKSKEIDFVKINKKDLKNLCTDMSFTMLKEDGVGLAAPQIGKNIRIVCINTKDGPIFLINPKILKKSFLKEWSEEGCLSVPEIFGSVKRSKKIKFIYFDIQGHKNIIEANGLMARVVQHEVDHLDGILFIDKAKGLKKINKTN